MRSHILPSHQVLRTFVLAFFATAASGLRAATVWTGPPITYTQPGTDPTLPANQDRITPNVWLTRKTIQGLFNAKTETSFTHFFSPAGTEWANGTTANYASLRYTNWNGWAKGVNAGPASTIGINAVVHLKSEDIYIDIKFLSWGVGGQGGFSYTRSTAPPSPPSPTVSITNPLSGAVFAAPANVKIQARATVTEGAVTNLDFFQNGALLGSAQLPPFSITTAPLSAGSYALSAVATAAGVSTTSSVVNITVVSPVPVAANSPRVADGQFSFDYNADPGLSYVIENSSDLVNWISIQTNIAISNLIHFSEGILPNQNRSYRVGRQPNP